MATLITDAASATIKDDDMLARIDALLPARKRRSIRLECTAINAIDVINLRCSAFFSQSMPNAAGHSHEHFAPCFNRDAILPPPHTIGLGLHAQRIKARLASMV